MHCKQASHAKDGVGSLRAGEKVSVAKWQRERGGGVNTSPLAPPPPHLCANSGHNATGAIVRGEEGM